MGIGRPDQSPTAALLDSAHAGALLFVIFGHVTSPRIAADDLSWTRMAPSEVQPLLNTLGSQHSGLKSTNSCTSCGWAPGGLEAARARGPGR